ncbi:MAG: amino acid racemase [Oscillospiraceae bacterium]|nr:amino acid racemase [Oscillospiraceae bacterium]
MNTPLLGIIGGMGTQATACFYEKLHAMQNVSSEQEYLDTLIYSMPSIPDRTAYIIGEAKDSPLEPLRHAARTLEKAGASLIAMLCITSHFFYDELCACVHTPFLSIPDETVRYAAKHGINSVGLLATDGTLSSGVLSKRFASAGIDVFLPSPANQKRLMKIIYDIKLGAQANSDELAQIAADLHICGAQAIVLGCTELCISDIPSPALPFRYINTLDVLAAECLRQARQEGDSYDDQCLGIS